MKYLYIFAVLFFGACSYSLLPVQTNKLSDMSKYKYAFVEQTQTLSGGLGVGVGSGGSNFGGNFYANSVSMQKSLNPSDAIAGILMKKGFVLVNSVSNDLETFIVRYGESGRRDTWYGYTLEVSIQMIDAKTKNTLFTCSAEGVGDTEVDGIRLAITRCLSEF